MNFKNYINIVLGIALIALILMFLKYVYMNQSLNMSIPLHIILIFCFIILTINTLKNHNFYFTAINLCGAISLIISLIKLIY